MPFPSLGCETCKVRRIKCDETRPVCRKCIKARRVCRGLTDSLQHSYHSENLFASGEKKRPRGPRSTRKAEVTSGIASQDCSSAGDLKPQAIAEFLQNYLERSKDLPSLLRSTDSDLLPIWTNTGDYPMLDHAVSAMALILYSRVHQSPAAAAEACLEYDHVLRLVREATPELSWNTIDLYLLAIFLMARYEDAYFSLDKNSSMKIYPDAKYTSFEHHDGALAALRHWRDQLSHIKPPSNIMKHTRRGLLRSALLRKIALPEFLLDGALYGEHGIDLEYDRIVVRVIHVRERLSELLKLQQGVDIDCHARHDVLEALSKETQAIDTDLSSMATRFPSSWAYRRHNIPENISYPTSDFLRPKIYTCTNVGYAGVWAFFFATRMLVNETRLEALDAAKFLPYELSLSCSSILEAAANDMASILPFCLGKVKTAQSENALESIEILPETKPSFSNVRLIIWPLSLAVSFSHLDREQRLWFGATLTRIGKAFGVGVLESVGSSVDAV